MTRKVKDYVVNFFNGFMMALADSVPGVSGGTIAFLLGFYDKFINSLNYLLTKNENHRKSGIKFLFKIGIGWVVGMISSILVLTSVFEAHIYKISSLFLGFIILSIPIIIKEEKECLKGKYINIIFTLIGIVLVFLISYYNTSQVSQINLTNIGIGTAIYIFLVGMVAISAMILPGISGSTLLLIFGLYLPVINGIKSILQFNFSPFLGLCIFGIGVLTGVFSIIKLLRSALNKFRTQTVYTIIGLMIGSIYSIIMGPTTLDNPLASLNFSNFSLVFFLMGGLIVWGLQKLKNINEKNKN